MTDTAPVAAWRRITAAVAPLLAEPRASAPLVSQRLAGHVVRVIASDGAWRNVVGDDEYPGWVHVGYTAVCDEPSPLPLLVLGEQQRPVDADDVQRARLPLGARLAADDPRRDALHVLDAPAQRARFPGTTAAIARDAATLFTGAPYLWGGISPWGSDCSGFVQTLFGLHGVRLPRDAWQQAEVGTAVAPVDDGLTPATIAALEPADLLFFSDRTDRRVTHVGVVLGGGGFVHAAIARGGVRVENLGSDEELVRTLRAQCVAARRVL